MRLTAIDVLQTSSMDCGPAAVASLLASLGRPIDLPRLREACQTDLDGTSIDVMAQVLAENGLPASQRMLPMERVTDHLPALVVVRLPDGAPHFVLVWRRIGPFVQVMDPARGGAWHSLSSLRARLFPHSHPVMAADWAQWARGEENLSALRRKARALGLEAGVVDKTAREEGWFPLATLDACMTLAARIAARTDKAALVMALLTETRRSEADIFRLVPPAVWPVIPDPARRDADAAGLLLQGAVLLTPMPEARAVPTAVSSAQTVMPRTPARTRALSLWRACAGSGPWLMAALGLGTCLGVLGSLAEALAFRHLIDPALPFLPDQSFPPLQTAFALVTALYLLRLSLGAGLLHLGRRVEDGLRRALMHKLLHLPDRWTSSRPLGDLAERIQSLPLVRGLPGQMLHLAQFVAETLVLTVGLILLDPGQAGGIAALAGLALIWPVLTSPLLRDREMTLRGLGGTQAALFLDALRGQAVVKAHRAEAAMLARQEEVLADWNRAARDRAQMQAGIAAIGQGLVLGLTVALALGRPQDLLFLWWMMKLPAAAQELAAMMRWRPAGQALLARLQEPLAVADRPTAPLPHALCAAPALSLDLRGATVRVAGQAVLDRLDLSLSAGEEVAVVGPSGSGKSSLIGLLLGWHDLAAGQMRVNGLDLGPAERASLRARTLWLDPTARLWGTTLAEAAGRAGTLRQVGLDLPGETGIGAGASLLSAGEGQRLRLAHALSHPDPALILCDEALRGLDAPRRRHLLALLRAQWAGRTLIWVTHDATEAMAFPRVLVMQGGHLVEDGPPSGLALRGGAYAGLLEAERRLAEQLAQRWTDLPVEGFHVNPAA